MRLARIELRQRANRLFKTRRLHVYGVGLAKTGTHYLAGMFNTHYRAAHEYDWASTIVLAQRVQSGALSENWIKRRIRERDSEWRLDVDVSHVNVFMIERLVEEFPSARFIATIRDCYSWLVSMLNHQLNRPFAGHTLEWANFAFPKWKFNYPVEEAPLKRAGLYCLDAYLDYWSVYTRRVLEGVPSNRLLVLRTSNLTNSASKISSFLQIPVETIGEPITYQYETQNKHDILATIPKDHLDARFRSHCKDLMGRLFPECTMS